MNIKTVIMSHNTPDTTEKLYNQLSQVAQVNVFDSGSDVDKIPNCPCEKCGNLYWTGCWVKAINKYRDADFLWVLGGDVSLKSEPWMYYKVMEDVAKYKIGCWSPAVSGRCRGVMSEEKARGKVWSVYHVEGIAMAVSGHLLKDMSFTIPSGNVFGWGVDVWMSLMGWEGGMRNVVDGRVVVGHPDFTGYSSDKAQREMDWWMEGVLGEGWRERAKTLIMDSFEANVREVTV